MVINVHNTYSYIVQGGEHIEYDLIDELRIYSRVKNPGARFATYHNDGYKYFCTPKGRFLTGFLPTVIKFFRDELGIDKIDIVDDRRNVTMPTGIVIDKFQGYSLYDHQRRAIEKSARTLEGVTWHRGIIDFAVNAGKTAVIAALAKAYTGNTLLLIHKQDLLKQYIDDFKDMFDIGLVHGKHEEFTDFTIAMYKTLYIRARNNPKLRLKLAKVNTLIVDEAHHVTGKEYSSLVNSIDAYGRFFLSGTIYDKDAINKMYIYGMSGATIASIKTSTLIQEGISKETIVHMYKYAAPALPIVNSYNAELNVTLYHKARADVFKNYIAQNSERQILLSVNLVEHGIFMLDAIADVCEPRWLSGETPTAARDQLIAEFKAGEFKVLVTTLFEEGLNAPIDSLLLAQGGKAKGSIKQYIGRIQRRMGKFDQVHVVDVFDEGDYLARHSRARIKLYREEGYEVELHYDANRFGTPEK